MQRSDANAELASIIIIIIIVAASQLYCTQIDRAIISMIILMIHYVYHGNW